jgi:hypothetical protein
MKFKTLLSLAVVGSLVVMSVAATPPKGSITGTVVAVTSTTITVQDKTQTLEIRLTAGTTVSGDSKVGATVTVTYDLTDAQKKEGPA